MLQPNSILNTNLVNQQILVNSQEREKTIIDENTFLSENNTTPPITIQDEMNATSVEIATVQDEKAPPIKEGSTIHEVVTEKEFNPVSYLQHLNDMFHGKHQYMLEMLKILLNQIPVAAEKMETAIDTENWQEVFFQSHRIKSTLKIVGLEEWVQVCIEIESRTRTVVTIELHLIPQFFAQFQKFTETETPRLEACVTYLEEQIAQSTDPPLPPPITEKESSTEEITFLLP